MSTPEFAAVPAEFDSHTVTFIAANGTACKVVADTSGGEVGTATSPLHYGGGALIDLTVCSTDGTAREVAAYVGQVAVTQQTTDTGTMATTTSTITRVNGSFITDTLRVGDAVMLFSPKTLAPNAAVDGILCVVTAVTATTLTLNGTPLAALTLAAGTRLAKVGLIAKAAVPISAGSLVGTPSVQLMTGNSGTAVTTDRKLGSDDLLIIGMSAAVSALPALVSVTAQIAHY